MRHCSVDDRSISSRIQIPLPRNLENKNETMYDEGMNSKNIFQRNIIVPMLLCNFMLYFANLSL